jgi:hypothetical protein
MSARNVAIGLLVAGAATWISSGEAASCKKAGTFCPQKTAAAKPAISKSPLSSQRGSGVVRLDNTVPKPPSKSQPPIDHRRERDSISSQFRGG